MSLWEPPKAVRFHVERPSAIRIMNAEGRLLRVVQPDLRVAACRYHQRRDCPTCTYALTSEGALSRRRASEIEGS